MIIRSLFRVSIAGTLLFTAGVAMAQHDMGGGGTTSGAATAGGSSSRSTAPVRRAPVRRTTPRTTPTGPVRRGTTAEQYNAFGDEAFKAEKYDDAMEAYQKAVAMKPIASAFYHIGWIHNDREEYDEGLAALQQAVTLNPNDAVAFNELGYSYRNLKRFAEALSAYRKATQVRSDYATPYYQI